MTNKIYPIACAIALLIGNTNIFAATHSTNDPATSIVRVLNKLEAFSKTTDTKNTKHLHYFIKNNILSHFALKQMSQWISGPYSQHMSMSEKSELQRQLEMALLNVISNNIGSFKTIKSRVEILPTKYKNEENAIVGMRIKLYNSTPVQLDLHMKHIESNWKITDVKANGASALIYYRQYFTPQLRLYAQKQANH